jgi:lysyl-tRNA synthetase class 2
MPTEKQLKLYQDRLKKLQELQKLGIDPYPAESFHSHAVAEVLKSFASFEKSKKKLTLVGRIRATRQHGGLIFGNLEEASGNIQFMLREQDIGQQKLLEFQKLFDVGDFLQITGSLIETQRKEKTLAVADFKLLAKSLRALPEKWHGLTDVESRLRKRYLDMISNPEVREIFLKKARFWKALREYLEKAGFVEVDTPALEDVPGGADATPFVTHHNALDRDFYLRISLELPLKKLLVGGFEKVYEIGKVFRNEGISAEHLQDYLECEFYWAYADYEKLMDFLEELYKYVVKETANGLVTEWQGHKLDWGRAWPRLDYFELFEKETGIKLQETSDEKLIKFAKNLGVNLEKGWGRGRIIDQIFKKQVRPKLVQPCFLLNHPVEVSPLAKRSKKLPGRVERVQVLAAGTELGNGWSELNDPLDQKQRFEEQMKLRERGDEEAQMMDESFVEALEYGMPPAAGFGLAERLFSVLMDKSIRETVIFPPMREERHE